MNYIIQIKPDAATTAKTKCEALAKKLETKYKFVFREIINGFVIGPLDEKMVTYIKKDSNVLSIEPDLEMTPQWAAERVKNVPEGSLGSVMTDHDADIDIFVLDSGVDSTNPTLNVVEEISFLSDNALTSDVMGHGTNVAGCIASRDVSVGIACGARLHSCKVIDDNGTGPFSASIAALDHVMDFKSTNPTLPVIANISVAVNVGNTAYTALDQAIVQAIENGVIVVVAAGNDKKDAKIYSPSHTSEAIVAGSYDKSLRFSSFSNYGKFVDILAPGVDVITTSINSDRSIIASGTSLSGGFVAGVAALIAIEQPDSLPADICAEIIRIARLSTDRIFAVPISTINFSVHCTE
jgi:subtilisin family serine protease